MSPQLLHDSCESMNRPAGEPYLRYPGKRQMANPHEATRIKYVQGSDQLGSLVA